MGAYINIETFGGGGKGSPNEIVRISIASETLFLLPIGSQLDLSAKR